MPTSGTMWPSPCGREARSACWSPALRGVASGSRPLTVLSCDNLPANGDTLRSLVIALAARRDEGLARWIEAEVAFPCSMVDRIVPATTAADIAQIGQALGVHDAAPVVCEPFRQWVIEDRFAGPRPAWELAGAELVAEVAPYEEMKLRLINASHSAIAYLGCLAGFAYVFEVMAEPDFVTFVRGMMAEAAPTLHVPSDIDAYQAAVIARFANPSLAHRTGQIAMDGSQKLPQRLLGTIRDRLSRRRADRPSFSRGRGLDALRERARRAGPGDRSGRSYGEPLCRDQRHGRQRPGRAGARLSRGRRGFWRRSAARGALHRSGHRLAGLAPDPRRPRDRRRLRSGLACRARTSLRLSYANLIDKALTRPIYCFQNNSVD